MEEKVLSGESGYMLMNKPEYPRVSSWPNLVWVIFLMMFFITILLWSAALLFDAPLEEVAEWAKTPNPAKAPWYFIGLQELLVYFDPWIAGAILPGVMVFGLMLIPFVDITPLEQGHYDFSKRKFAVAFFTFGALFWFFLVGVGQFLRGPSWQVYWPFIDYDIGGGSWVREGVHLKEAGGASLVSMSLGTGLTFLAVYFVVGMLAPLIVPRLFPDSGICKKVGDYVKKLGAIKYSVVQIHLLMMLGVVGKMILRQAFNIRYIIETPWFKI